MRNNGIWGRQDKWSLVNVNGGEYLVAEKGVHPFYDTVCRGYTKNKGLRPTQEA